MPRRYELLVNNEVYHVYNRSTGGMDLFKGKQEIKRGLELLNYYKYQQSLKYSKYKTLSKERKKEYIDGVSQNGSCVEIYVYSLMPDHYHILIKQLTVDGISNYMANFQNAFAKYFNLKNDNRGSVFIHPFKAKRIVSDEILMHVSRYIHLNHLTSYLMTFEDLQHDVRTSLPYYIGNLERKIVNTEFLLKIFGSAENYVMFLENRIDYQRKLGKIKNYLLDK